MTRALGSEIPHWVGNKVNAGAPGKGRKMSANSTVDWMHKHGESKGWRKVTAGEAQKRANAGDLAVVLWSYKGLINKYAPPPFPEAPRLSERR